MKRSLIIVITLLSLTSALAHAGIRSEGKYSGVVIFDRWGGCILYSGIYVMYVSEDAKDALRKYAGKCIEVDATEVFQPVNPGDALIRKLEVIGPAPAARNWEPIKDLRLTARRAFTDGKPPAVVIRLENIGTESTSIHLGALAPTLLARKHEKIGLREPSDGPSMAVITRNSFSAGGEEARLKGGNHLWQWTITDPRTLERIAELKPKEIFEITLALTLPEGKYDFLAGYGGGVHEGQCIASNLIGFDVAADGNASLIKIAGR